MSRRIKFGLALASMTAIAAIGAPALLAAGDTDDNLSPASTAVTISLKAGTSATFTGSLNGTTVVSTCTSSSDSAKTPAHGLTFTNVTPPKFGGCSDNFGGTDTVTTSGTWKLRFVDAANDETGEVAKDAVALTIPQSGAVVTSSLLPGCTITVAPSAAVTTVAHYDDHSTVTFNNKLPVATNAACGSASTGTATFKATYVSNRAFHDAS